MLLLLWKNKGKQKQKKKRLEELFITCREQQAKLKNTCTSGMKYFGNMA